MSQRFVFNPYGVQNRVCSAVCVCGSKIVKMLMEDNSLCKAQMKVEGGTREVAIGDDRFSIRGFECSKCSSVVTAESWKAVKNSSWFVDLGILGHGFKGILKLVPGNMIQVPDFILEDPDKWIIFDGSDRASVVYAGTYEIDGVKYVLD